MNLNYSSNRKDKFKRFKLGSDIKRTPLTKLYTHKNLRSEMPTTVTLI